MKQNLIIFIIRTLAVIRQLSVVIGTLIPIRLEKQVTRTLRIIAQRYNSKNHILVVSLAIVILATVGNIRCLNIATAFL